MNDFDIKLRELAQAEKAPAPEGFEERLAEQLAGLPEKKRRPRTVKWAMIAACLCMALVGTAAAAGAFPKLIVTDAFQAVRPDGKEISGYTVQGGVVEIPLEKLSDEARTFAAEQMRLPATKDCESWSAAEEFIGIEVANNSVLDQLEPAESSVSYDGKEIPFRCGVTISGRCDEPSCIELKVAYRLDFAREPGISQGGFANDIGIGVSAMLYMDSSYSLETDAEQQYRFQGIKGVTTETYVTPGGLETVIATMPREKETFYFAHFVLNGARFEIFAGHGPDPEQTLEVLKQVLDAFEVSK